MFLKLLRSEKFQHVSRCAMEGTSVQDAYMFYKNVSFFLHKTHWHEDCNTMFIKSRWFCEEARVVYHVSGSFPDLVQDTYKNYKSVVFF